MRSTPLFLRRIFLLVIIVALAAGGAGCNTSRLKAPSGAKLAVVPGFKGIREWGDVYNTEYVDQFKARISKAVAGIKAESPSMLDPRCDCLALSGGAEDGAYGAGVLCGWTDSKTRPKFAVVTGISTGALIAPFAFLGPKYDKDLREVYTTIRPQDIFVWKMFSGFFGDALADTEPLRDMLQRRITDAMMQEIAAEDAKGRQLLIGTTNLDAGRPVIWDIGAIASTLPAKASRELIINILIASSAVPAFFPPVLFDVEGNCQELHVDGGVVSQVFFPDTFHFGKEGAKGFTIYVIRNGKLDPDWKETDRKLFTILKRSISQIIRAQGKGDILRIYNFCVREKIKFQLAYIPATYNGNSPKLFDTEKVKELFDTGYKGALDGSAWHSAPPDYDVPIDEHLEPATQAATKAATQPMPK